MAWMAKMIKLDVLNEFMKMTQAAKMIKLDVLNEAKTQDKLSHTLKEPVMMAMRVRKLELVINGNIY